MRETIYPIAAFLALLPTQGAADEITVRVCRQGAWTLALRAYSVYINDAHVGEIGTETIDYRVAPAPVGYNTLRLEMWTLGQKNSYGVTSFNATDGDVVQATFYAHDGHGFPIEIKHLGNPRRESEEGFFGYVTAEKSLAPKWFKSRMSNSLKGTSAFWRDSFVAPLIQSTPVLRLLALYALFYPIFGWLIYRDIENEGDNPDIHPYWIPPALLLATFPAGWILAFLFGLGAYALTGTDYYMPTHFVIFSLLVLILGYCFFRSVFPLKQAIFGEVRYKRYLGAVGAGLELFGIAFTIRDIVGLATLLR